MIHAVCVTEYLKVFKWDYERFEILFEVVILSVPSCVTYEFALLSYIFF